MASLTERLSIIIDAKTGGAVGEFRKLSNEADKLTKKQMEAQAVVNGLLGASGQAARSTLEPIGKVEGAIQRLSSGLGISTQTAKAGLTSVGTAAAYLAVQLGVDAVQAASALNEQVAATKVTFGDASASVLNFSSTTARALGISRTEALQASNSFGAFFNNVGVAEDKAAQFSEGLVQLAGDLASFKNLDTADVLEKLRSGLSGEVEPLRALGVFLNEAAVKAEAAELGFGGAHRELTDGEKILARYSLIIKQTSDAQGDAARTGDSLANKQRQLSAQWEDAKAIIGQGLLPIVAELAETLGDVANAAITVGDKIGGVFGKIGISGKDAASSFISVIPGIGQLSTVMNFLGEDTKKTASTQERLAQVERDLGLTAGQLTNTLDTQDDKQKQVQKSAADLASAVMGTANADRSYASAKRGVLDAEQRVTDARARLNTLLKKSVVDTEEVARAERSLRDASRSSADAQERLADAQRNLDKVRAGTAPRDIAEAERNLQRALLDQEEAQKRVTEAGLAKGDEQVGAVELQRRVSTAYLDVADAAESVADAQDRLTELQGYGKEGSQSLRDAQRQLRDAQVGVESAAQAEADAQTNLNTALAGDPSLSGQIQQAKRDLAAAEQGVADAKWNVTGAAWAAAQAHEAEAAAFNAAGDAVGYLSTNLSTLVSQYPELAPLLAALGSGQAGMTQAQAQIAGNALAPAFRYPNTNRGRAGGGPVSAGQAYTWREHGEEKFMPMTDGWIFPTGSQFGGGGGGVNVTIVMPPGSNGEDVVRTIKQYERRSGARWRN